jgi:hypothetical protein
MKYFYCINDLSGILNTETEDLEKVIHEAVNHCYQTRKHTVVLSGVGVFKVVINKVIVSVVDTKKFEKTS